MRRAAVGLSVFAVGVAILSTGGCRPSPPASPGLPAAACPRDAHPDATGRCACDRGDVPLLGACVPPPIADAYCGPAARAGTDGACVFRACADTDAVDVDAGCIGLTTLLHGGPRACGPGESLVLEERRAVCIPADAACPRGTRADGLRCVHPPTCPPGTLGSGATCRPIVLRGDRGAGVVDLGAWATLVLGPDGGRGSADLCRPFQTHPAALEVGPTDHFPLRLRIALSAPGNDVTRVSAEVHPSRPGAARPLPVAAAGLAESAVATLVEALRGLGGEASAVRVDLEVACEVAPPPRSGEGSAPAK